MFSILLFEKEASRVMEISGGFYSCNTFPTVRPASPSSLLSFLFTYCVGGHALRTTLPQPGRRLNPTEGNRASGDGTEIIDKPIGSKAWTVEHEGREEIQG